MAVETLGVIGTGAMVSGIIEGAAKAGVAVIARDIDEYNAVGTEVSAAAGIPFVDITPISRSGDPDLVSYDDLHPSGSQYAAWVEEILPVAIDLLEG